MALTAPGDGPPAAMLRVVRAQDGASQADLAAVREHAAAAATAGVTMATLVKQSLRALADTAERGPRYVASDASGLRLLDVLDELLVALADGYQQAHHEAVQVEEAVRRRFLDELLNSHTDVGGLVERAERFGVRLAGEHVVAVAGGTASVAEPGPVHTAATIRVRAALDAVTPVLTVQSGALVVLVPVGSRATAEIVEKLSTTLAELPRIGASPVRGDPQWRVGVGRPHQGLHGLRRSFAEARESLDLSRRLRLPQPVAHTDQLLVYRVLLRDRTAMTELVTSVLAPLQRAHTGPRALVDTLQEYFSAGCVTAEAARRLHLSVRAVTYRLARVRALTGYDPTDSQQRFALHVAVTGAQLLGWPDDGWDTSA